METLREVFNNREIAIGFWIIIFVFFLLFTNKIRETLKSCICILFCRKFVLFYAIFLGYFIIMIYFLFKIDFWEKSLLKETIFWVIFVELPIFAKAIEKAEGSHFFVNLIKDNIKFIVIIEFIFNFWTFGLFTEILIVPVLFFVGALLAFSSMDSKYKKVRKLSNVFYLILVLSIFVNTINSLLRNPMGLFKIESLKVFVLPFLLLLLNLPVVYGLGLYNMYEQVFIRLKGNPLEQRKMKFTLFRFAGIVLSRITAVRNNHVNVMAISLTNAELKGNLEKLQQYLNYRVGENYMKRAKIYLTCSILGLIISFVGIIACNSEVDLKELLSFKFTLDIQRVKEIGTYIFSCGVVMFLILFVISIALKRKKYEEISNVKKYVIYDLLYIIKRQSSTLQEYIPIDSPKELYLEYLSFAYELKNICDNSLWKYENLLTSWELDVLKKLQTYVNIVVFSINIDSGDFYNYSLEDFSKFFLERIKQSPKNEKFNNYLYGVKSSIEKYSEQIEICMVEFKYILP